MSGFSDRYTVQSDEYGLLDTFSQFEKAESYGQFKASSFPDVSIYDRMARHGQWQEWRYSTKHCRFVPFLKREPK